MNTSNIILRNENYRNPSAGGHLNYNNNQSSSLPVFQPYQLSNEIPVNQDISYILSEIDSMKRLITNLKYAVMVLGLLVIILLLA